MPERQILGFGDGTVPRDRTTKDSETFTLLAVNATFDGSSTTAPWLPVVEVVSDSGAVVARHKTGETVAAGGSAEVTFAPFLRDDNLLAQLVHTIGFYTCEPSGGPTYAAGVAVPVMALTFGGVGAGTDLLDTSTLGSPTSPCVKADGMYSIMARIVCGPDPPGFFPANIAAQLDMYVTNEPPPANFWSTQNTQTYPLNNRPGVATGTVGFTRYFIVPYSNPASTSMFFQIGWARTITQAVTDVGGSVVVQRHY